MKKGNYQRKFGNALSSVPVVEAKELLIKDNNNKLKKIHPLDVKYEGSTFGLIKDLYKEEIARHTECRNAIEQACGTLISTLIEKGYNTPNVDLKALIDDISKLLIIEPTKGYYNFKLNSDGYVVGKDNVQIIVQDNIQVPDDWNKGYYKIIDGVFVLDEERYKQMWSV